MRSNFNPGDDRGWFSRVFSANTSSRSISSATRSFRSTTRSASIKGTRPAAALSSATEGGSKAGPVPAGCVPRCHCGCPPEFTTLLQHFSISSWARTSETRSLRPRLRPWIFDATDDWRRLTWPRSFMRRSRSAGCAITTETCHPLPFQRWSSRTRSPSPGFRSRRFI